MRLRGGTCRLPYMAIVSGHLDRALTFDGILTPVIGYGLVVNFRDLTFEVAALRNDKRIGLDVAADTPRLASANKYAS